MNYNFQPKGHKSGQGWYDRGYIPHFDGGTTAQFITFRLYDSLPKRVIERMMAECESAGLENVDAEFRKRVERYLDNGHGECFLEHPDIAEMLVAAFQHFSNEIYRLHAWVVMPNHSHILISPFETVDLRQITHSIKSYTAHRANKMLGRTGQFWQHESFDRYIRNANHFHNVIDYIENNPVMAGLCAAPGDWRYSSAFDGSREPAK